MAHLPWPVFLLFALLGSIIGWNARRELQPIRRRRGKEFRILTNKLYAPPQPAVHIGEAATFQIFPRVILFTILLVTFPASSQTNNSQAEPSTAPRAASEHANKEDHSYLPPSMRDQINRAAERAEAGSLPSQTIRRDYKNKSANKRLKRERRYAQSETTFNIFGN